MTGTSEAVVLGRRGLPTAAGAWLRDLWRTAAPDVAVVALLGALCLLFYWRILTPDRANRASFPDGDFVEQFYAFASFRAHELSQGRLPLWSPHAYGGHPFIADIQSAVFYPPSWLTTWLTHPRGYPFIALEAEAIGHVFLASLFAYLFARQLFRRRASALVAALVFAYGGYITSYPTQQLSILETQVWLPLILLCLHRATAAAARPPRRLLWALLAAVALGVSTLGGHPQAAMYVLYGTALYWAYRLLCLWRDGGWRGAVAALQTGLYLPLGLALAAVQLLPTMEYMQLSSRAKLTYEFTWWGFPLVDVLQLVLPGSVSLASPMYVGILPLVLVLLAVLHLRQRDVAFWAGLAVAAFLVSFGGHTFLYSLLYLFGPGFATFRDHERAVFLFSLSAAMLAGYGSAVLLEARDDLVRALGRALRWSAIGAFALLVLFYTAQTATGKFPSQPAAAAFTLILVVLILGALLLRQRGAPAPAVQAALVAIIALDLFTVNWKNNLQAVKPEERYALTPVLRELVARARGQPFRVHNQFQLPLNYGAVYGVADTMGASPLVIARYKDLQTVLPREKLWQLMSVKYLVTWEGGYPGGQQLASERTAAKDGKEARETYLYQLADPVPLARVVSRAVVADGDEALAILAAADFDPRQVVVLPSPPPVALSGQDPQGAVSIVAYRPDRLTVDVRLREPGLLSLAEVYYPGWQARVDGQPAPLLRANYALRAVPLPPGEHRVELTYDPFSFRLGAAVSLVTLAGLVAALLVLGLLRPVRPT